MSKIQRWIPVMLGLAYCLWGVGGALFNNAIVSCLQNGCIDITFDESPMGFLFMLSIHLLVGYGATKCALKLAAHKGT